MTHEAETTFIREGYRALTRRVTVEGVEFLSYRTGISRFAQISTDGQIIVRRNYEAPTYGAGVIGHGPITGPSGKPKIFRHEENAARAAIQVWRKMQEPKA